MGWRRAPKPFIPEHGDDLTADWFTTVLADRSNGARVTELEHIVIGEGVGFVGELHRCRLVWDRDDDTLPPSVIVKLPAQHPKNRALAEGLMAYEREIRVYRDLGGALALPMPELYHCAMDPAPLPWLDRFILWLFEVLPIGAINWLIDQFLKLTGKSTRRYVLVLEDIDDARPPTQAEGGSVADVEAALIVLARFHAAHWMDRRALDEVPLLWSIDRGPKVIQAGYVRNRDQSIAEFGHRMPDGIVERMDRVQQDIPALTRHIASEPWTLLHGDYRLDNLLFRPDGRIVVLDYQGVGCGRPGWDATYFITTALAPEHRAEEERLLRLYHDELVAHGGRRYSWDDLQLDVRITKDLLAHRIFGSGDLIDTELLDGDDTLLNVMVDRVAGWVDLTTRVTVDPAA